MSGIAQKEAEQWAEELNQAWLEERTGDKKRVRFPEPRGLPISFSPDGQQAGICAGQGKEPVAAPVEQASWEDEKAWKWPVRGW